MSHEIEIRRIDSEADLALAMQIRDRVFVEEQGIPMELEHDEYDAESIHVLACRDDVAVATARLTLMPRGEAVLARVAVLPEHRAGGIGGLVVKKMEELARAAGVRRLTLHPHHYLERFYADLGYARFGGTQQVGPHRLMEMEKTF